MPAKPRILVLNNYSFERVAAEGRAGDKPAHHLYAVDRLEREGYEVELCPFDERPRGPSRLPIPIGDLAQQRYAWKRMKGVAAIYAPCQTQTQLLAYARAVGLVKTPMVVLLHHPLDRGRAARLRRPFNRLAVQGADRLPCLSSRVADQVNETYRPTPPAFPVQWGPDMAYYPPWSEPGSTFVSAGRTGRDHDTFVSAAIRAGVQAEVYRPATGAPSTGGAGNVRIVGLAREADLSYRDLIGIYATSLAIAIPLHAAQSLLGLTSLADALAMGRAVVMTRNRFIDLDIEAEGIGIWVEPYDVDGWEGALRRLARDPELAREMGLRARAIAEQRVNLDAYADAVIRSLSEASRSDSTNG